MKIGGQGRVGHGPRGDVNAEAKGITPRGEGYFVDTTTKIPLYYNNVRHRVNEVADACMNSEERCMYAGSRLHAFTAIVMVCLSDFTSLSSNFHIPLTTIR